MGHKVLLCLFVKILERLAARFLMLRQIVVCSVGDSLQLLHPKWEMKFDVISALRIMSAFFRRNFMNIQKICSNSDIFIEFETLLQPILKKFNSAFRTTEIFQLHLLKLP